MPLHKYSGAIPPTQRLCENSEDATGLSRWSFTMVATTIVGDALDATGLPRGAPRWSCYLAARLLGGGR